MYLNRRNMLSYVDFIVCCNTPNCLLLYCTQIWARRLCIHRQTRENVHTHVHTLMRAHCRYPYRARRVHFPTPSHLDSSARNTDQQQLQRGQAVARPRRASLSHAADRSSRRQPRERGGRSEWEREREPRWLSAASAGWLRREHSIGRLWTARSRRSEEGGRSAKQRAAEERTHATHGIFILSPTAVPRAWFVLSAQRSSCTAEPSFYDAWAGQLSSPGSTRARGCWPASSCDESERAAARERELV